MPNSEGVFPFDARGWAFNLRRFLKMANRSYFLWRIADFLIGGLFIYAGVIKTLDPIGFANDIDNYKSLPWALSVRLAFYLPWLEIICGLALILRRAYQGGLFLLTGLIFVFIVVGVVAKARGIDITCGCFGHVSKDLSFGWHLALDFGILGALIALWLVDRTRAQPL